MIQDLGNGRPLPCEAPETAQCEGAFAGKHESQHLCDKQSALVPPVRPSLKEVEMEAFGEALLASGLAEKTQCESQVQKETVPQRNKIGSDRG